MSALPPSSVAALERWLLVQAVLWLPALAAVAGCVAFGRVRGWMVLLAAALMAASWAALWRRLAAGGRAADRVTAARFAVLLAACAAAGASGGVSWAVWAVAGLAVLGDLADGWCARRWGGSAEGAVLDMETDQMTTLGLAVLAAGFAGAGAWVLLLPAFRHGFVLAMAARGLPAHEPRPVDGDNRRGRAVCALVMTLLLVCACPATPPPARVAAGLAAVAALAWSFAGDAAFLLRRRRDVSALG